MTHLKLQTLLTNFYNSKGLKVNYIKITPDLQHVDAQLEVNGLNRITCQTFDIVDYLISKRKSITRLSIVEYITTTKLVDLTLKMDYSDLYPLAITERIHSVFLEQLLNKLERNVDLIIRYDDVVDKVLKEAASHLARLSLTVDNYNNCPPIRQIARLQPGQALFTDRKVTKELLQLLCNRPHDYIIYYLCYFKPDLKKTVIQAMWNLHGKSVRGLDNGYIVEPNNFMIYEFVDVYLDELADWFLKFIVDQLPLTFAYGLAEHLDVKLIDAKPLNKFVIC